MGTAESKLRSPNNTGRTAPKSSNRSMNKYGRSDRLIVKPGMFVQNHNSVFSENYKAIKLLGKGSFGEVLLCCNRSTGMQCAVKIISKGNVKRTSDRESLLREIELLKELDHPHIMKLFEFFEDRGYYYLVTEYYSGGELFDEISARKRFNEFDAAVIIKQVLNGINYMHKHNIVHRDLKPENLVLESKNDIKRIRIIDFGLSTHFDVDKKMKDRIGTAYYIAPEVLKGTYNEKCDIWSTGVILYILLCGYPPFNGPNENEIIKKVTAGKFSFSGQQWSRVSDGAKNLIEKMLTFNPYTRISADKALLHPWLCKHTKDDPTNLPLLENTIKNIRSFHYTHRLAQAALLYIGSKLMSKDETRDLTDIFKKMDKNGDGQIDRDELISGYKDYARLKRDVNFKEEMVEEYVDNILLQIDFNKNGFIDYSEFITVAANYSSLTSNDKLEEAFKLFDADKSGKISSKELSNVFGVSYLDPVVWKNILQQVDLNRDGEIDFIEFKAMLRKFR